MSDVNKGMFDGFKRAFQKKFSSAESNFDIRKRKVEAALADLDKAIRHLKSQNSNAAPPYEQDALRLRRTVQQAETEARTHAKRAFEKLESVKEEAREIAEKARRDALKTPVSLDIGKGGTAKVYPSDIPGFLGMEEERKGEVLEKIGAKITNGRDIVETIFSTGDGTLGKPGRKEISEVAWFLKAKAQEKMDQPYERGAMTLPDEGNKLRNYFDKCDEVYGRDSSHLKEQQSKVGGKARGIDFYEGVDGEEIGDMDTLLPNGMRALLYQKAEVGSGDRLYVKMETESARVSPLYMLKTTIGKGDGETPRSRPLKGSDVPRSIIHGINLIKSTGLGKKLGLTQGEDKALAAFREKDVHPAVAQTYKTLLGYAEKNNKPAYKILKTGKVQIHQICTNIKKLYDDHIEVDSDMEGYLMAVSTKLEVLFDDIERQVRFGDEVVLQRSDMGDLEKSDAWDDDMVDIDLN